MHFLLLSGRDVLNYIFFGFVSMDYLLLFSREYKTGHHFMLSKFTCSLDSVQLCTFFMADYI